MTQAEQQKAAKKFSEDWKGKGYEKGESQKFWLDLLCNVYGVQNFANFISFEDQVKLDHTSFIDGYIASTKVLIEQKSLEKKLRDPIKQSDGTFLNPFQQAKRYITELPVSKHPRWVVTCNFKSFLVYDMEQPNGDPEEILLENFEKEYYRLSFITDHGSVHLQKELEISKKAGDIIGEIYDAILAQYKDAANPSPATLKSLNMLCVRIVFCLYAEDAGIFGHKSQFGDYLKHFEAKDLRRALIELFQVLDQKEENRDEYLEEELAAFPYVNGGLFTEEDKTIPPLTNEIKELLVGEASTEFDWSEISPTIFGAIFESTLNPETRRSGGMHYTSIENIHKVIDPLFLNDLKTEFETIKAIKAEKTRNEKLIEFQKKLGSLKFLDPACGSGNFLTEAYLSLRNIENECIKVRFNNQSVLDVYQDTVFVKIHQFYGIEINDFAAVVAKTALWIAESQMMEETSEILHRNLEFLPLKSYANIVEGNALKIEWSSVVPKEDVNYIFGNPPFVGARYISREQHDELVEILKGWDNSGKLDYVCGWYKKSFDFIKGTKIKAALVSTNSITQGEQVANLWKPLFNDGLEIVFAYRTFRWDSESNLKAHVHCVIIGFSDSSNKTNKKIIYNESGRPQFAKNINGYLVDAENIFVDRVKKHLCQVPPMVTGNRQADGGFLTLSEEEKDHLINKEPEAKKYIRQMLGSEEFINNKKLYCLWLRDITPDELRKLPLIFERVKKCQEHRLGGNPDRKRLAATPTLFREQINPDTAIIIPTVSSEKRRYVPMGFIDKSMIVNANAQVVANGTLYNFGVLTSNVHMAWMRAVAGRLKSDYRYSKDIVYNNFPWPDPTKELQVKIQKTAQGILDARIKFTDSSLADLYDEIAMPLDLRKAHQENDKAVMLAYGFNIKMTESECVAELFKMYEKITKRAE